jgi:WD repeat and SOF domain-containing protein 1
MDKIFAKPFLGALTGHSDGVVALSKSPTMMTNFLSGSFDGEIK